jgi:hypothetical protein
LLGAEDGIADELFETGSIFSCNFALLKAAAGVPVDSCKFRKNAASALLLISTSSAFRKERDDDVERW